MTLRFLASSSARRLASGIISAVVLVIGVTASAQIPGRNVNMVSGTDWPGGDPFLQRQNEPSLASSTRNPLHLIGGSNDYRTVDVPGLPDGGETGDAWLSIYKSFDGGQRWSSTLLPGFPQDVSPEGLASPVKGYQAGADPVVRAGTSGLVYYSGLVFDRGANARSGIFMARFIDRNNKENGDPINYLGTSMVVQSAGAAFLDKPWMAVDIPRGNLGFCRVGGTPTSEEDDDHGRGGKVKRNGHKKLGREEDRRRANQPPDDGYEYVAAGAVYVAYSSITGEGATLRSEIFLKRSVDCGATWSAPMRVSNPADPINQGASIAIDPRNGHVFVAWRRFASASAPDSDALMVARLPVGAGNFDPPGRAHGLRRTGPWSNDDLERIFEHRKRPSTLPAEAAELSDFDQGTSGFQFRSNAYPTMTIDGSGRVYLAWTERGFASARPDPVDGDSRILVSTTTDGKTFTAPAVVDDHGQAGHQLMPSLAFAGGKLMLVYYDVRDTKAEIYSRFISDADSFNGKRQTIDIRASVGTLGAAPSFAPSVRVSDYLVGSRGDGAPIEQLQVNPPNLPMFKLGTVPFIGDYIDLTAAPAFVPTSGGGWAFNSAATAEFPLFHAAWTDNRDVRPPLDGNWQNYAPPGLRGGSPSLFDPTQAAPFCQVGNAGSRNQNVYTARIGGGLLVGAPGNAKQLSPTVQRAFVVFAQNQTTFTKTFRMRVLTQPPGGRASFEQFPLPPYSATSPAPTTFVDLRVPPRSTASRTVYATSSDPKAQLSIDVSEIGAVGGAVVNGGLAGRVVINPDIANPDIANPDIANPDIANPDIANAEVYNPDIANPDIANPDIANPDIVNPDIANPDIANPDIANISVVNPDIANLSVATPDIANPDIANPDIANPDIANPDIANGAISDISWTVSNIGNTTSAFNANLFVATAGVPAGLKTQLIVYKTYKTPVASPSGCELKVETRNEVLFNVPNPSLIAPGQALPDQNNPSEKNATLWLNPGEVGRVTLRVFDSDRSNNVTFTNLDGSTASIDPRFNPATVVTAAISAQGVDILDPLGATEPPAVTTTGTNLFYLQQPTNSTPGATIAPPVSVRVWDNTGAPLPGVLVSIALYNPPGGVLLSGTTMAAADLDGIATFGNLAVNVAATGLRLRATATSPGVVAAGTSAPFDVLAPTIPATVTITDSAALFDGSPKPVTITTVPPALAVSVTYSGSPTVPGLIGAYNVQATVTSPGYVGSASAVLTIASTLRAGGSGGSAYGPLGCGASVFAHGFSVNTDFSYALTSAQLLCSDEIHPAKFGGGTVPNTDLLCPLGQIMVGFFGTSGPAFGPGSDVVTSIGAKCQLPSGGAITQVGPLPGGGTPFSIDCPATTAVIAVVGGQGAVVDSIALVCGSIPPTVAITSVSPAAQVAPGQMLTINGTSLPATSLNDVLFNQGGPDLPAQYMWGASSTLATVRLPALTVGLPTTVRLKDPGDTVSTNSYSLNITSTPGTPVLTSLMNQCSGGTPITSLSPGSPFAVEGEGIDTSGTTFVWTPITAVGTVLTQTGLTSTGGPTGRVCSYSLSGAPTLSSGTWSLQLRTQVGFATSALSNAIVVTVP